jgi:ATP-binding cassette, subfamily F, member 3
VLAGIVWQRPNLLLLDEPTNHLDLTTREALSVALNEFEGTVMLVSHDRALLREVCDEFWLVAKGALGPFDGDLDDYQRWLNENSREAARALASEGSSSSGSGGASKREDRKAAAQARAKLAEQQKPMRKRVAELEALMAKGERNKGLLEAELAAGAASGERIAEIGKLLKRAQDAIDTAETEWLSLQEVLESKAIN